ncbi:MAG: YggS family pyridoxal phosphate-dependent enzyme [Pseudomonadota bacterium]
MPDPAVIAENLAAINQRIARAARLAGRAPDAARLLAVSKGQDEAAIEASIVAGHGLFGENRVQEAQAKWPAIKARHPQVALHLIGPLQSNKARAALALFDAIHSLDRPKLARELARLMAETGRRIPLYIEVNTGGEGQKAGVAVSDLPALIALARDELALPVVGLMAIPPAADHPGPHFALLAKLAARHGLEELSMGMSGDFEQAVMLGATVVRVGTALFGARPRP